VTVMKSIESFSVYELSGEAGEETRHANQKGGGGIHLDVDVWYIIIARATSIRSLPTGIHVKRRRK
jgi:hypothetical protein